MYKKLRKSKRVERTEQPDPEQQSEQDASSSARLSTDLDENIQTFSEMFGDKSDLVVRRVEKPHAPRAAVLYLETLIDDTMVNEFVLDDLSRQLERFQHHHGPAGLDMETLDIETLDLSTSQLHVLKTPDEVLQHLLKGDCVVFLDRHVHTLAASTPGGDRRAISEANNESVVRGPRESFNETLQTNLGLIRRRIRSPRLHIEKQLIGTMTNTPIALVYLDGVADDALVQELKSRLAKIDLDGVLDSNYLEEMLEDPNGYTPFPTIFNTERPDRIAAGLLEGRVALLVEGTPVSLLMPAGISMFLYANEDYYQRYDIATFLRLLRTFTFFMSIFVPGFYIAVLSYHQEMIPTPLLIAFTGQREGVPLGIAIEVALMELTFEILREAGIRLPKTIGSAVSIVGGLVLGQAAVEAGLVASGTVITVSLTAIASFCTPAFELAIAARLLRFLVIILSASLGAFGFFFSIILLFTHLNTLRSFGMNYLEPVAPFQKGDWRDLLVRYPWYKQRNHEAKRSRKGRTT